MAVTSHPALEAVDPFRAPWALGSLRVRTVRLTRKHVLMLALAVEIVGLGIFYADRYRPVGITVEQPVKVGHAIA